MDEFEMFRPKPSTTAPMVVEQLTQDQKRMVAIARLIWRHEYTTLRTHLEETDNEPCELCGEVIAEGPAWLILDGDRSVGYTGPCCFDLATYSGVTRAEVALRAGKPSHMGRVAEIPAGAVIYLAERIAIKHERDTQR